MCAVYVFIHGLNKVYCNYDAIHNGKFHDKNSTSFGFPVSL